MLKVANGALLESSDVITLGKVEGVPMCLPAR